ncbi:MAG: YggS family pyridoxal phosphate-dependent enzyme [Bacteroidales bacterium]|nr:YggS family pyridoxal phosphate-dependent enzyme [Bacteroidales bacterium]
MMLAENYRKVAATLKPGVRLVAVSKYKTVEEILEVYHAGQRIFGENKAQEMKAKQAVLPGDIEWHFIGHLQSNKIKYIAPYVALIHSIDSFALLKEVNKEAAKHNRVIPCLLQFHIAQEETKFGLNREEADAFLSSEEFKTLKNVRIDGVMGMATFTDDAHRVREEFASLHREFDYLQSRYFAQQEHFKEISMGMSEDYTLAMEQGSTLVRVGSAIFGARDYSRKLY